MITKPDKNVVRKKRHARVRAKISGTPERPRLSVYRSNKHIYAQLIDDTKGVTLVSGQSPSTFASLMNLIGMTPYEAMVEILSSERYAPISIMTTS